MKKVIALVLAVICILGIVGCNKTKYKVKIEGDYPIVDEIKSAYAAGEKVTVKLQTITEHYYVLYVNGVKQEEDDSSNMEYTYYTFTMPEKDVIIKIEQRGVNIPQNPYSTNLGKCSRIWDRHHPDDSEINPYFSVTVPKLGNALIEHKEDCKIYVNGEVLIGGPGNGCESFYLADITGDGAPELCFGMNTGSGILDLNIAIFDYETRNCVFSLSDRMNHDYILFARDGNLCVMEMKHMTSEVVRTGVLSYDGSQISVSWDSEVNADRDRETTNSGLAIS